MTFHRPLTLLILLLSLPALGACNRRTSNDEGEPAARVSRIDKKIEDTREEVRQRVSERNITLSADDNTHPTAEITPAGDLLVGGDKVTVNAEQRALLLQYRGHVEEVAAAGAEIGMQGAKLATKAMGEAVTSIFNGDTDGMEKRIEAEAEKIEVEARVLCERMPGMLKAQQAVADALPAFRPYATMDGDDVSDCQDDIVKRD